MLLTTHRSSGQRIKKPSSSFYVVQKKCVLNLPQSWCGFPWLSDPLVWHAGDACRDLSEVRVDITGRNMIEQTSYPPPIWKYVSIEKDFLSGCRHFIFVPCSKDRQVCLPVKGIMSGLDWWCRIQRPNSGCVRVVEPLVTVESKCETAPCLLSNGS